MAIEDLRHIWPDPDVDDDERPGEFALRARTDGPKIFIDALKPAALATDARTGIPAGFIIAQAALESGWGRYVPKDISTGEFSYNLFGIKATRRQPAVTSWTWEADQSGQWHRVKARFRAYGSYQESLDDHARLLTSPRYVRCLPAGNVAAYAYCIHQAGYATDPHYADKIIQIMRRWGLLALRAPKIPTAPGCRVVIQALDKEEVEIVGTVMDDGRAWAPVRAVAKALGARVYWDEATRTVRITR